MTKETANDLIHTNAEYEKLKTKNVGVESTPRETPAGQGPGRTGYDKAIFASWTLEELQQHAGKLGIDVPAETGRDALIAQLESHDATLRRSGS